MSGSERFVTLEGPSKSRRRVRRPFPLVRRTAGQQMTHGVLRLRFRRRGGRLCPDRAGRRVQGDVPELRGARGFSQFPFAGTPHRRGGRRRDGFAGHLELARRAPSGEEVRGPPNDLVLPGGRHQGPGSAPELAEPGQHVGGRRDCGKGGRLLQRAAPADRGPAGEGPMKVGEQDGVGVVRERIQAVQSQRQVHHCHGRNDGRPLPGNRAGGGDPRGLSIAAQEEAPPSSRRRGAVGRPAIGRRNRPSRLLGARPGSGCRAGHPGRRRA